MQKSAAFFDVDETLINIKSMFDFFDFWCHENNEPDKFENYMTFFQNEVKTGTSREKLNRDYYRQFSTISYKELEEAGENWFRTKLDSDLFIDSAVAALKKHQADDLFTVFISGSMHPIISPIANHLGVTDIFCAPLEFTNEQKLTGEIGTPQTIGRGKKEVLIQFCNKKKINPTDCYAYGDDLSDIAMLESTGHPVCVGKDTDLARHAIKKHWLVI